MMACSHRRALNSLLNVARYDELAYFVAQADDNTIATVIDLLQMFRDKKAVFSVACELMCRIMTADHNAKVLINFYDCNEYTVTKVCRHCAVQEQKTTTEFKPFRKFWKASLKLKPRLRR